MKKITAFIPLMIMVVLLSCNKDEDVSLLEERVDELEDLLDSASVLNYKDSLDFILALNEQEYKKYIDSLRRADSLAVGLGNLPFTYSILVYDGSTTAVYSEDGGTRTTETAAFDGEVTVSLAQFGEVRTVTTTDGLASFDNIGRGLVKVTVKATDYTTLQYTFTTIVDPTADLYPGTGGDIDALDYWNFVKSGSIGHDVALFATTGQLANTLTGRVFVETDLTNSSREVVPEGTVITAAIDVENGTFRDEFILNRNKSIFTDVIGSFGYDPIFTAATDANGDYTFTLAGAANDNGLPYKFEYSDFLADQIAYVQTNTIVNEETEQTIFGPAIGYSAVPVITLAPTVSFEAGGGAEADITTSGNGSLIDVDVITAGQDFQGTPRVIIPAPTSAIGTQATATATLTANGRIDEVTLTDNGSGYSGIVGVTITEGTGAAAQVTALNATGTNGGIGSISLQNSGNGYVSAPNVVFSSGALDSASVANYLAAHSDAPTATATLNSNGTVANINVTNSGSDLGGTPNVYVTSGIGAQAQVTAVGAGGVITGITITNNGDFYTDVPNAVLTAGAGTGATFNITVTNGQVTSIAVVDGGTGYELTTPSTFSLVAVGSGATATAMYQGESIEDFQITNAGTQQADGLYYTNAPAIVFPTPAYQGPGSARATGTAVLDSEGRLIGINVTNIGSGYYTSQLPLTINIVSGSGATATAVLEPLEITEVEVTASGSGYIVAPAVAIYDAGGIGSGATATANINNGQVTSITLTNAGSGYTNPQVAILDPGTSFNPNNFDLVGDDDSDVVFANAAKAEVVVEDGVITSITMLESGDNYPAGTNVVVNTLRGTGFVATTTVTNGQVVSVTITDGGNDYVNGNNPVTTQFFSEIGTYAAKTSITRVRDIHYGTGQRRDD